MSKQARKRGKEVSPRDQEESAREIEEQIMGKRIKGDCSKSKAGRK